MYSRRSRKYDEAHARGAHTHVEVQPGCRKTRLASIYPSPGMGIGEPIGIILYCARVSQELSCPRLVVVYYNQIIYRMGYGRVH